MAHFAKISQENEVLQVLTLDDENMLNAENIETESIGQQYLEQHNNWPANLWIQTSFNTIGNQHILNETPFRGNYAATGFIWDETNQMFFSPQPYASWTKNLSTATWEPPIAKPSLTSEQQNQNNQKTNKWWYGWNETTQAWELTDALM